MAAKTKAELMEEINELKNELQRLEKYKQYENVANEFGAMREAFVAAGFTKTEAFTMVMKTMELATNPLVMAALK